MSPASSWPRILFPLCDSWAPLVASRPGAVYILFPCQLVWESEVCNSLQNSTEMAKTFAIFRANCTGHLSDLLSRESGKCNFSTLSSPGSAGMLIIFVRTSIKNRETNAKRKKKTNHPAQKALLRLHSGCFYNINNKSNFTAWWLKEHGCMEQLQ